jgi:hypothetical protein
LSLRKFGLVFLSGQNASDQCGGVVAEALLNPRFSLLRLSNQEANPLSFSTGETGAS